MRKRLFVIFLDGADYAFTREAFDRGLLPNLARLAARGAFVSLATSCPAESPVAFAEILTGCNPGKHGLFDFLHRDPATYMPHLAAWSGAGTDAVNLLARPTVCTPLAEGSFRSALVKLPCTYPPPPDADLVLSGLGVPDLAGAWGSATLHTSDGRGERDLFGIVTKAFEQLSPTKWRLDMENGAFVIERVHETFRCGNFSFPSGRFSPWMPVDLGDGPSGVIAVHTKATASGSVFLTTPIWAHPEHPAIPALFPKELGRRLMKSSGLFPLAGWPEPDMPYARGLIGFDALHEMAERAASAFEAHLFDVLSDPAFDLVMGNYEFFDRVAHAGIGETASEEVGRALTGVLIRFDAFIGKVADAFPDARVWAASDHGFAPWKKRVNINRWLAENGYLAADLAAADPDLSSLANGNLLWAGVDWSKTRAYSLGLSKIYLNLEGREARGAVPPGRPAELLMKELSERLADLRDPENGGRVFSRILDARRLYWGRAMDRSGDLVLCYNRGYRTDWVSSLGGTGSPAVCRNESAWRADHCGTDPAQIPGILFTPDKLTRATPGLRDIAPSILRFFGLPPDASMDGKTFVE